MGSEMCIRDSWAGQGTQSGWLLCDGSAVSRSTYSALFGVIGTIYGPGDGVSTFNLPNGVGRSFVGSGVGYTLGSTGGSSLTTLRTENLPAHTHTVTDPGHHHASVIAANNATAGGSPGGVTTGNTSDATTGITIGSTGSGTPFSTQSPYFVGNWLIKT